MRLASLILMAVAILPHPCPAEEYLPLQLGNRWEYTSPEGDETREVTGTFDLWGEEVYVIGYPESVHNLGLENYWTTNVEGDVFVWGFWVDEEEWGVLYSPPIPVVDTPLYLDKTWSHTFDTYVLPDTTYAGQNEIGFRVYWEGVLSVPAGDFFAYGIGQYLPVGPGFLGDRCISGELAVDQHREEPTCWYSDGVGEIQYWTSDVYRLVDFGQPVAVAQTSWGAVKALYGPVSK